MSAAEKITCPQMRSSYSCPKAQTLSDGTETTQQKSMSTRNLSVRGDELNSVYLDARLTLEIASVKRNDNVSLLSVTVDCSSLCGALAHELIGGSDGHLLGPFLI